MPTLPHWCCPRSVGSDMDHSPPSSLATWGPQFSSSLCCLTRGLWPPLPRQTYSSRSAGTGTGTLRWWRAHCPRNGITRHPAPWHHVWLPWRPLTDVMFVRGLTELILKPAVGDGFIIANTKKNILISNLATYRLSKKPLLLLSYHLI